MTGPLPRPGLRWRVVEQPAPEPVLALREALELPEPLATLLVQRGHGEPASVRAFLRPSLDALSPPDALTDLPRAVEVIVSHVRAGHPIVVHGDYDVDGQCATAILTRTLRLVGAAVEPFVPHRVRDGYDFGPAGLARAEQVGARLIITCDCGTNAHETVARARAAGIDVIVTDHHLPPDALPPATAVVNPRRPDSAGADQGLCGAGVAFKLIQALVPALALPGAFPFHLLDYVALATVADLVPLVGENRILVRHGLKLLRDSRWPGIAALGAACGLAGRRLDAGQIGYILAPRLNAVGRIADAAVGLRLLLTDDPAEAATLAGQLETWNERRQELDQRILDEAVEMIEGSNALRDAWALVLASERWHPGVIGIVASRLVERYGKPAILVAWDADVGRGSGRSVPALHLFEALAQTAARLERFGGHRMAAGLTVRRDAFAAFRDDFIRAVEQRVTADDLVPSQRVDLELPLAAVDERLGRWSRHLEPCGAGNPAPVYGVRHARMGDVRVVGNGHLRFTLADATGELGAIAFGWADHVPGAWRDGPLDIAFKLDRNDWRGQTTYQARVVTLAPAAR